MWAALAYAVVIAAGLVMIALFHKVTLRATPTIVLFVLVLCLGFTVLRQQANDAAAKQRQTAAEEHVACLARVDRSAGNREMWAYVIELLSSGSPDIANSLQTQLDINLPALDTADC